MTEQIKKSKTAKGMSTVALVALFLTNFAYMSDLVIIPTADVLYGYFLPMGVEMGVVDYIMSGSQLLAIIGALLSVVFMRYFSKRTIILVLYTVFTLITASTVFFIDAAYIAATRAIAGFCFGALFPTGIALIMEMYRDDEEKCERYIGFSNGTMGLVGALASIISGFLLGVGLGIGGEAVGLQCSFALYFISVPILIALFVSLPKTPAEKDVDFDAVSKGDADEDGNSAEFPVGKTIAFIVSFAVAVLLYCFMSYQYARFLPQHFELDTTLTAFLGSLGGLMSCIAGFVFGSVFKKTGRYTITWSYACFVVAFLLFGLCPDNLALVILGLVLNGLGFGFSVPYFYGYAASQYPARFESLMSSLITVAFGVGQFLCTFVTTWVTEGLGLVSFDPVTEMPVIDYAAFFLYVAGAAAVAFVLSFILATKDKMKNKAK